MKEQLQKDMILAMKEHDRKKTDVIKLLKAAIQMEEINLKRDLSEDEITSIIVKQVKMRKDAISDFEKANRVDLIDEYNLEIGILNNYLPEQLSDEEVMQIINEAFETIKPEGKSGIGLIMKEISPKLKGKADMAKINEIIKNKLL